MPAGSKLVVVAGKSTANPNGSVGAQLRVKLGFNFVSRPVGVSTLAKLHGLGEHHIALAIDMDAATLVDHFAVDSGDAGKPANLAGNVLVFAPDCPLRVAPAVEDPIHPGQLASGILYEARPGVAQPAVVERGHD